MHADMAAQLLSLEGEQGTSTSSFRPPGGPTPTRGFFLPEKPHRILRERLLRGSETLSQDAIEAAQRNFDANGSLRPCGFWPETSAARKPLWRS